MLALTFLLLPLGVLSLAKGSGHGTNEKGGQPTLKCQNQQAKLYCSNEANTIDPEDPGLIMGGTQCSGL